MSGNASSGARISAPFDFLTLTYNDFHGCRLRSLRNHFNFQDSPAATPDGVWNDSSEEVDFPHEKNLANQKVEMGS